MDYVAGIVAIISLLISIILAVFYFKDHKRNKFIFIQQYSDQIYEWYKETIFILFLLLSKYESNEKMNKELCLLSALIERGRFFFPNIDLNDGFGLEKGAAFKGYRNLTLDFLVAYYNLFKFNQNDKDIIAQATKIHRNFTSIIFEVLRPIEKIEEIKKMTDRYFVKDQIFDDFMNSDDKNNLEYMWKNYT